MEVFVLSDISINKQAMQNIHIKSETGFKTQKFYLDFHLHIALLKSTVELFISLPTLTSSLLSQKQNNVYLHMHSNLNTCIKRLEKAIHLNTAKSDDHRNSEKSYQRLLEAICNSSFSV